MVPKFFANQRPKIIPEPIRFPGMVQLFPNEPARLLCIVSVLGLYSLGRLIVLKKILKRSFCAPQPCYSDVFYAFRSWVSEISPDVWKFFRVYLPRITAHNVRGIFALILMTGILLWKNYAVWLDENRPTFSYSSAIILETWRPIRTSRTSLWWPHGRLSCNLVSYLLITRHLHQCSFNFGSLSMAGGNIRIV